MYTPHPIGHVIADIITRLKQRFDDPILCQQYAWWIVQAITKKDQAHLIAQDILSLSQEQEQQLNTWINNIVDKHMPLQYLIGSVPFTDLTITVRPPTLIPRPETEEWVTTLINQLKQLNNQAITIIDLCTGTGCVALALAHALPESTVWAIDIAPEAITLAKENAKNNGITNIHLMQSDLFTQLPNTIKADLIIANPPYLAESEWQSLDNAVSAWEDKQALVAHDNGFALIKKIIAQAPSWIKYHHKMQELGIAQLIIEIGYLQGQQTVALMQQQNYNAIRIEKDLAQKDRVVLGRIDHVAHSTSCRT